MFAAGNLVIIGLSSQLAVHVGMAAGF